MSKENPNDNLHWKLKLDSAYMQEPVLPDKEAAWDKLQQRLHQKPVQKERAWYWAAAILLVLFTIPFLISKNKTIPIASSTTNETFQTLRSQDVKQIKDKKNILISHPIVSQKIKPTIDLDKSRQLYQKSSNPASLIKPAVVSPVSPPQTPAEIYIASIHIGDSIKTIAIISSTAVKKLKTVHINELEPPASQMASSKLHKSSYSDIRFGNRMMDTAPFAQSSDPGSIFKIKF